MKKFVAALLCLVMLLSLFSCRGDVTEDTEHTEDTEGMSAPENPDASTESGVGAVSPMYEALLRAYRRIVNSCTTVNQNPRALAAELGIQDEAKTEAFLKLCASVYNFYPGLRAVDGDLPYHKLGCGYAQKDLNGDGIEELVLMNSDYYVTAVFSYADGTPVFLGNYMPQGTCYIDGEGRLHKNLSDGAMTFVHCIYEIAQGGESLVLLAEYGAENVSQPETYYETVNGEKSPITEERLDALNEQYGAYLGSVEGAEATKQSSGLTFIPLFTEAEIAIEMYESLLSGLASYLTPYSGIPLSECANLKYACVDLEGDSVPEYVIDCGDTLIMRYYQGSVCIHPFIFRQLYYLMTDGSFSWNHTGSNFEYGENQLYFEGHELKIRELTRIVNDGEPDAEYYVEGEQVTKEELLKYIEENPRTRVEFFPLDVWWNNRISEEYAKVLAEEYWEDLDVEANGYLILPGYNENAPDAYYVFAIQWFVIDHYSTFDEIWIHKQTGEAVVPYGAKG